MGAGIAPRWMTDLHPGVGGPLWDGVEPGQDNLGGPSDDPLSDIRAYGDSLELTEHMITSRPLLATVFTRRQFRALINAGLVRATRVQTSPESGGIPRLVIEHASLLTALTLAALHVAHGIDSPEVGALQGTVHHPPDKFSSKHRLLEMIDVFRKPPRTPAQADMQATILKSLQQVPARTPIHESLVKALLVFFGTGDSIDKATWNAHKAELTAEFQLGSGDPAYAAIMLTLQGALIQDAVLDGITLDEERAQLYGSALREGEEYAPSGEPPSLLARARRWLSRI